MSFGDFGATSFFPSKNLGGFGDSGLVTTSDDSLAERARILRVHGMKPKYHHQLLGANFRMDPLQAALLRAKLPHLPSYNCDRARNAGHYRQHLLGLPGIAENRPGAPTDAKVLLPVDFSGEGIWNQFTLRIPHGRRDAFKAFLAERQIGCEVYYPITLDRQECFRGVGRGGETCTTAHLLASEVVSIPVFPELSDLQRTTVTEAIATFAAS
jgi:dTDP-4-amino-4,6-dideoxygalactose transaminase